LAASADPFGLTLFMTHPSQASRRGASGPHKNVTASGLFLVEPRIFRCHGTFCLVLNEQINLFVCCLFATFL
jgi:hypothetical protein